MSSTLPLAQPDRARLSSFPSKQKVIRGFLASLLKGHWKAGDRLTEAEAVERFGVSRTPVREALLELQGLGLVELRRNCGAVILPFGPKELREIYAVRSLLEVEATRLAALKLGEEWLREMKRGFAAIRQSGGVDPGWELDRKFHSAIAAAAGNRRLAAEIERYGDLVQTVREIVGAQALGIHATTADEHLAIIEAMLERDAPEAAKTMRAHLAQAADSAVAAVEAMRK